MSEPLTVTELSDAFLCCALLSQQSTFSKDIRALRTEQGVPRGSPLHSLMPFIDENGTLRVGGRLDAARLTYAEKHPVILSKNSRTRMDHRRTTYGQSLPSSLRPLY